MRRLIYAMLTSLDLYIEGPDGTFEWATPDAELHKHFNDRAAAVTTHLHGRRLCEVMADYWATAGAEPDAAPETIEFAGLWNAGEHIVFSHSLQAVGHGARLVRGDAVEAVRELKAGEGTDIDVGGAGLASMLIEAGLVDEIDVYANPVVVGGGKPFLPAASRQLDLTLLGIQTFSSGVVQLRYTPRSAGG